MDDRHTYESYIKCFNQGYFIRKYLPDLYNQLVKSLPKESIRTEGFKDGRGQYEMETEKSKLKFLRQDRLNTFKMNRDQIKDKGDTDKEMD